MDQKMDVGAAFSYIAKDEAWVKKLIIGSILVFTGIGTIPALGWMLAIVRKAIKDDFDLPEWSNFGTLVIDGLKYVIAFGVYYIPIVMIAMIVFLPMGLSDILFEEAPELAFPILLISLAFMPFVFVLSLILMFVQPALTAILADTGSIFEAINPMNMYRLYKANFGEYIVAMILGGYGVTYLASFGFYLFCVGMYPAQIYAYTVQGHLFGQAYRRAKASLELAEQTAA
ncbi:MAG: DUF4013 domain-containing protein [Chloroflexi bacterium]|nr:DUF4013 domain-containing protein [Chloroflexota bacterium]